VETIRLFKDVPKQAAELAYPMDIDHGCRRCALHKHNNHTTCMNADGEPGGLLVISDWPGQAEDASGRPLIGETGKIVRQLIAEMWDGPVVYDNAVKCYPRFDDESKGSKEANEKAVSACRGYLAGVIQEAQPERILCLGGRAIEGVLGRKLQPMKTRQGYAWLSTGVPVFYTFNAVNALRNRHLRKFLREDMDFALRGTPKFGPMWHATAQVVETEADALEAERVLMQAEWFSLDAETAGHQHQAHQMLCCALFPAFKDHGFVWSPDAMRAPGPRAVLKRLFQSRKGKTGNNIKFDFTSAKLDLGAEPRGLLGDNRLMRKVMMADGDGSLEVMAEMVGMGGHKGEAQAALEVAIQQVRKIGNDRVARQINLIPRDTGFMLPEVYDSIMPNEEEPKAFAYGMLPREVLLRYVCRDALTSRMLHEWSEEELDRDAEGVQRAWHIIVKPAAEAIRRVEDWGIYVDRNAISQFEMYLKQKQEELLNKMAPWGLTDPGNPHAVGAVLFDKLKLPGGTKTPKSGQWATDEETLGRVAERTKHVLPNLVVDFKSFQKLQSNYATGMQRFITPDSRIHPDLMLDGAESGRASCKDPNLQNIPRDGDSIEGKMARDCFTASPGCKLISLDYSQLELRIAAALSGDAEMRKIFEMGGDFHHRTAEFLAPLIWKIPPEKWAAMTAKEQKPYRSAAKAFNFGILYGMSDKGIAARGGTTEEEAIKIRNAVLGKFFKLKEFCDSCLRYSKNHGHCWTWWDGKRARRRPLWEIGSPDGERRSVAEHSSWNTPIQGTGSDFCLMSLTAAVNWILEDAVPAKLVLPVHDSLLLDVREDCVDEVAFQVHRIMTSWNCNGVPVQVDVETGHSWGSMQKYDAAKLAA